jgi:hypothetical protein
MHIVPELASQSNLPQSPSRICSEGTQNTHQIHFIIFAKKLLLNTCIVLLSYCLFNNAYSLVTIHDF